jgi:hypothetical protein
MTIYINGKAHIVFRSRILGRPLLSNARMALVLPFLAGRWRIAAWLTNSRLRI